MSQKKFNTDWLNERFAFDNAARNPEVEQALFERIEGIEVLNIVDIGSGTGSNVLYFTERLKCDQNWVLIEQDAALCEAAKQRILANFPYVERTGGHLIFQVNGKNVSVKIVCDSFYNIAQIIDLQEFDVVVAAAVFDVLSRKQFENLMNQLSGKRLSLFSTMNYSGMRFFPEDHMDQRYVNLYENHMLRPQDFGVAMGKNCMSEIEACFPAGKQKLLKGKSLWNLGPKASKMHSFILGFMEKSISEMLHDDSEKVLLQKWLSEKLSLAQQEKLKIEVAHFDFLVEK